MEIYTNYLAFEHHFFDCWPIGQIWPIYMNYMNLQHIFFFWSNLIEFILHVPTILCNPAPSFMPLISSLGGLF